jgi:DNA replication and repair protein RecF
MYVDHLQLTDFRSYESVDLPFEAGVTTFVGANGQARPTSSRPSSICDHEFASVASEVPLVRSGATVPWCGPSGRGAR